MKAQSLSEKSYRIDNGRTWSRIRISRLPSQCCLPKNCLCKLVHKREFTLSSCDRLLWPYPSWILPLCFWYAPSCTQRDASVMTQGTPKDDESFTRVIHSSFEWDEGAWETLLSFTFRPLVCLSVCLAESTVILCWCMSWLVVQGLPLSSGTINPTPGLPQSLPHAWEPSNLTFGSKFSSSSSFQLL